MTINELKTLLDAATPGPWEAPLLWDESGLAKNKVSHAPLPGETWKRDTPDICVFPPALLNRANARFVPVARNLLPAFLRLWEACEMEERFRKQSLVEQMNPGSQLPATHQVAHAQAMKAGALSALREIKGTQ